MDGNTPSAEDMALDVIVNAGKPASVTTASSSGNQPSQAAPAAGQPASEGTTVNDSQTGTDSQTPVTGKTNKTGQGDQSSSGSSPKDGADVALDDTDVLQNILGLPPVEPESVDTWRRKYEESSREAHRIVEERTREQEALKAMGLQIVHVGNGEYTLAPTSEYTKQFNLDETVDFNKIVEPLTEDQKDALIVDPDKTFTKLAKGIAKKVGLELLAKRPPLKDGSVKPMLTETQMNECFTSFTEAKRMDGNTPVYPDANKPEVVNLMAKIWEAPTPAMNAIRESALTDKGLYMAAMELCYYKAAYGISQARAKTRATSEAVKQKVQENKQGVSMNMGSAGIPSGASASGAALTAEDQALDVIARARPM